MTSTIAPAEALQLTDLIAPAAHGIASRILSKTAGGSLTLFAFDAGQGLAEFLPLIVIAAVTIAACGRRSTVGGQAQILDLNRVG